MGLWTRVKRSMRALFGGIVEATEDPELILQQTIRDMRDRIPDLNNSVAQVMATEKLLGKNKERLESQVVDMDSKIKASVKMGRDDIATAYIGQLSQAQLDLQRTIHQYEHSQLASKQALKARDNYMLQMQRRTAEAMQLINQSKQAKLQEQLAQTMASFQIGDDAGTFDEMRDKIDRRAAAGEARMQLAGQAFAVQERHGFAAGRHQRRAPGIAGAGRDDAAILVLAVSEFRLQAAVDWLERERRLKAELQTY